MLAMQLAQAPSYSPNVMLDGQLMHAPVHSPTLMLAVTKAVAMVTCLVATSLLTAPRMPREVTVMMRAGDEARLIQVQRRLP